MPASDAPIRALTIYLLKDDIKGPKEALRDSSLPNFSIGPAKHPIGVLFVRTMRHGYPRWAEFFSGYVDRLRDLGKIANSSAVFLVKASGRIFALTFGQGRYLLKPGAYEERFGLKVALNSIHEDQLRSIDKHTFDAISRHTRIQASRAAAVPAFGLDIEQDLLRAVTGISNDERLGKKLSGMDALHTWIALEVESLQSLLALYLDQYQKDTYKETFPWVDHIAAIGDPQTVERLDDRLAAKLRANDLDACWLAVPEIVDWAQISGFRYGSGSRSPECHDLNLPQFLEEINATELSIELLKRRRAIAVSHDGTEVGQWPLYQCLHCEIGDGTTSYLLTGGKWYCIDTDFVKEVNNSFATIPRIADLLPEYDDESETLYCQRVAHGAPSLYALMDRKLISIGGAYNKIEFCDLFSVSNQLIHIKRYAGSSVLSHLFAQGVVSAEAFRGDTGFRKSVNKLLPDAFRIAQVDVAPTPANYTVIFGVISDSAEAALKLPFFSRISARHAARRLQLIGFQVALTKIAVNPNRAITKKYKRKRR